MKRHLQRRWLKGSATVVVALACVWGAVAAWGKLDGASVRPAGCFGRYAVTAQVPVHLIDRAFQFYWGDVQTYRESAVAYEARLREALARARQDGGLIEEPKLIGPGSGTLFVRQEELGAPYDPNASEVVGLTHIDGVTFEYKKRTVNRLRGLAKERAQEILAAAHGYQESESPTEDAFCVGDGVLTLARQRGWYESVQLGGTFNLHGFAYGFLLSIRAAPGGEMDSNDLEDRRQAMLQAAGAGNTTVRSAVPVAQGYPGERLLYVERQDESQFPVYEWEGAPEPAARHGPPERVVLHIWPERRGDFSAANSLVRAAQEGKHDKPFLFEVRPLPLQAKPPRQPFAPAGEESKLPWAIRLLNRQTMEPLAGRAYTLHRNDKAVFKGRSDPEGYTLTQNIDYFETLTVRVEAETESASSGE
ncbi:hypothetical protein [Massilia horti]|uniref:Tle cognate immunity protein 4 C-terminal domain-containing protein n=1 Tax=Massilia horti TaxID=2562153 RepID=A0A4Y9SLQ0_9BURK|nr:hypothetical protein [Massilia horti]TFW27590.1 hypothetical protein E4O92_23575 [Massilia horti]